MSYWNNTAREDYPGEDAPTGERSWLADSGYDYDHESEVWSKDWESGRITARKDYKGKGVVVWVAQEGVSYLNGYWAAGEIKAGDLYFRTTTFEIDDRTGERSITVRKQGVRPAKG